MRRQQDGGGAHDQDEPVDENSACDGNLSAELRYEAPLATFDGDEWTEFLLDLPPPPVPPDNNFRSTSDVTSRDTDTFVETFSGSLEDLVNTFDAKITECFRNYNEHADEIAPVQIRTQDQLLADSQ